MLALIIFNLCLLLRHYSLKQKSITIAREYSKTLVKEERISQKIKKYSIFQQIMEGTDFPEITIDKGRGDSLLLSSLLNAYDVPVLCFRFKDSHCDACIQHAIRLLNKISKDSQCQIVVMSGYANFRQFKAFENSQNGKLVTYNIEDIECWEIDDIEQIYFFVFKDGKIHNVFVPLKEDEIYMQNYINSMIQKYWK